MKNLRKSISVNYNNEIEILVSLEVNGELHIHHPVKQMSLPDTLEIYAQTSISYDQSKQYEKIYVANPYHYLILTGYRQYKNMLKIQGMIAESFSPDDRDITTYLPFDFPEERTWVSKEMGHKVGEIKKF